ncbi:SH3 domain-containing protein [Clostridium swellfunianum]|uniref:SH3 domain-containing protein n=1 Tax=Clostridium swellfunianum TaxID=1367462 RepID=UPI00202FDA2F|nr:SH3 domain-containing protein [Clostridium swellfunianum]MCM0650711.1 SH3 domain-containing protein [Clostridium swellfunianum]
MTDIRMIKRLEEFPSNSIITPGIENKMLNYSFWTSKLHDGKGLVMNSKDIKQFNEETIRKADTVYNLQQYKESLSKKELSAFIKEYKFTDKMKVDDEGKQIKKDFLDSLIKNTNLEGIKEENKIEYGMSIKKLQVRGFPTEAGTYESADSNLDRFQETSCEPCEAVLILHKSKDKKWYFIQTYNYRGWVKAEGIAIAKDKKTVFDYINSENFVIVTGNHVTIDKNVKENNKYNEVFNMGNKISLVANGEVFDKYNRQYYVLNLPLKTEEGYLGFKESLIAKGKDIVEGYLPYTRENIIKQAFKLQGEKYDWGNKFSGRDCSSFIADIYKTFGIMLPRNAGDQESSHGKHYKFDETESVEERNKILDNLSPGAAIFSPGHVMMYLGKIDGVHYMIHDFLAYGKKIEDKYVAVPVAAVAVTSTLLTVSSGVPYIRKFSSAVQFEN